MKTLHKHTGPLIGAVSLIFAPILHAAEIVPITSFDPNTFFADGITAGIDFDVDSSSDPGAQYVTQAGFLSVPATTAKSYNVTHNGITFDIVSRNNNLTNQSRWRNNANAGDLMNDFQQFFGDTAGSPVEATITLTGLAANTVYLLNFFTYNVGAGQTTHTFYDGASSAGPLITTFTTSGNQNTYATWVPGIGFKINSGASGEIAVTIKGTQDTDNNQSRLTFDGMSVTSLGPAPMDGFQLAITPTTPPATGYDFTWPSQEGKFYDLLTSTDLATPLIEWPIYNHGVTVYQAIPGTGETVTLTDVPSPDPRRFFAVREYVAPPPPVAPELSNVWGSGTTITLNFSRAMQESSATNPGNYTVELEGGGSVTVTGASLSGDGKTVTLTLGSALGINSAYNVNMSNLAGSNGAPLGGSAVVQFQTWDNDPDGIKVFILAGQSNMVGYGHSETGNGGVAGAIGSLRHLAVNNASFPDYDYASLLVNPADPAGSAWKTRGDVKAWWRDGGTNLGGTVRKGDLGPPFLGIDANRYGPEYAFGQVLGDYYVADDVLIIKAAWGGKSLAVDFRPPSAVARVPGTQVGPFYHAIFDNVRDALTNLGTEFPAWSGKGYQIVGFGWHQGWNDRVDQTFNDEYEANMKNFIDDVRVELGKPVLPFVIATTGMSGWNETHPRALSLMNAQLSMANFTKYPAHEGNVSVVDTRDFWRAAAVSPIDQGFHWNQNGETLFLIGKSMGDRMVNLLGPAQ
jgi:hypothetical protein